MAKLAYTIIRQNPGRELRSSRATTLQIPLVKEHGKTLLQTCSIDLLRLCDLAQISQPLERKLIKSCKQGQANDSLNINTHVFLIVCYCIIDIILNIARYYCILEYVLVYILILLFFLIF